MKFTVKYVSDSGEQWLAQNPDGSFCMVSDPSKAATFPSKEAALSAFYANGRDVRYRQNVKVVLVD